MLFSRSITPRMPTLLFALWIQTRMCAELKDLFIQQMNVLEEYLDYATKPGCTKASRHVMEVFVCCPSTDTHFLEEIVHSS